jgi:hypothetical protein
MGRETVVAVRRVGLCVVVVLALLLAACGGGEPTAVSPTSSTGPALSAPTTTATIPSTTATTMGAPAVGPAAAGCRSDQLRLTLDRALPGASNQAAAYFQLMNVSGTTCTLDGYPGFAIVDASGSVEDVTVTQGSSYEIDDPGPHVVTLAPGQAAYFGVGWAVFDMVDSTSQGCVDTFEVASVPPHASSALRTTAGLHDICPEGGGLPKVTVTAVAPKSAFTVSSP